MVHAELYIVTSWWAPWRLKSPASRLFTSTVYSGADQRKHQSSASLAFVRGIHRWPVNSPQTWPATWKMFPFDDVISSCLWDFSSNPPLVEAGTFRKNRVNTVVANASVHCVAMPSATTVSSAQDKLVTVFHEEEVQLLVSSRSREMIERENPNLFVGSRRCDFLVTYLFY